MKHARESVIRWMIFPGISRPCVLLTQTFLCLFRNKNHKQTDRIVKSKFTRVRVRLSIYKAEQSGSEKKKPRCVCVYVCIHRGTLYYCRRAARAFFRDGFVPKNVTHCFSIPPRVFGIKTQQNQTKHIYYNSCTRLFDFQTLNTNRRRTAAPHIANAAETRRSRRPMRVNNTSYLSVSRSFFIMMA